MLIEREFAIFLQLARGEVVGRIADHLNLSPGTIGMHPYHVKQKLGARAASQADLDWSVEACAFAP